MFSIKFVSKPDNSFSVACIQLCSGIDIETNLHQSEQYIRQAASEGASLICTPEMTHLFQRDSKRLLDTARYEEDDKGLVYYCSLAKELSVTLVIGSLAIKASNTQCVNRGYCIDSQGEVIARYDKIHLFDATVGEEAHHESHTYIAGNQAVVANTNNVRIGMTICYDLRFPQLFSDLATAGAHIIVVPAAFTVQTGQAHWHTLLRARAIETGCYILAPAQCGTHEDGRRTYGHSLIVSPWGEVLSDAKDIIGVSAVSITLDKIEQHRRNIPNLAHKRRYLPPNLQ